jgi:glucosyl-3-phosphoglycerate synthase
VLFPGQTASFIPYKSNILSMEYVQERIGTLHDFGDADPAAAVEDAAVVVPLAARDHGSDVAADVFRTLEAVDPAEVIIALRASPDRVGTVARWLDSFDVPMRILWCTAPAITSLLGEAGVNGSAGKGRDVWLALGVASRHDTVVVHDADARSYDESHVPRLLFPLEHGYEFSKAYYARIEDEQFYGRLFRLFYRPLVRALGEAHAAPILDYLASFRYALAGEFAMTGELARQVRVPRGWGLELGTLGDAFAAAGFDGTAQVDLGFHRHEHRPVDGAAGLKPMASEVFRTLCTILEEHGVTPDYETLPERYRAAGKALVEQYETDAVFNNLAYDAAGEREQVDTYAESIELPARDKRLPAWEDAPLAADEVAELSGDALAELRTTTH